MFVDESHDPQCENLTTSVVSVEYTVYALFIKRQIITVETKLNDQQRQLCKYMYLYLYIHCETAINFSKSRIFPSNIKRLVTCLFFLFIFISMSEVLKSEVHQFQFGKLHKNTAARGLHNEWVLIY